MSWTHSNLFAVNNQLKPYDKVCLERAILAMFVFHLLAAVEAIILTLWGLQPRSPEA